MIITDLITRGNSPWEDVYSPSRITVEASAKEFLKENADVAVNFFKGKLSPAPDLKDIKPGEGKVAEVEEKKVGVYCDASNQLHFVDTSCTHLGCGLKWNAAEKTWDCPCHGSRFTYEGEIVEGPALKTIKTKIEEKVH
jgi:Rieske Fe-S protein